LVQYSSFLRVDAEQNPQRGTAREFRQGLLTQENRIFAKAAGCCVEPGYPNKF
jgi:hypothetical protein